MKSCGIISGEMSAKTVAQSYWTRELEEELEELGIREKWLFTTNTAGQPLEGSEEQAIEFVEKNRSEKLYDHDCSNQCKKKGCGKLYVADDNWKLCYAHCMWKVPVTVPGFGDVNYPTICPSSPEC